ncbi:helix-turn-helix transcriptional regulator [Bengtsoniella intestinalis]|uniref:helix-turn-helix domain-containing protein n=1 Tax=Bengtsoniella intestinalis TaxID=3073143 RepID=UPI00391FB40B
MEENIFIGDFASRLNKLRQERNVSARDMSISLGQSHNFIHNIEVGRNFPTMLNFFYICEFMGISPKDFFDYGKSHSARVVATMEQLEALSDEQFDSIASVIEHMNK